MVVMNKNLIISNNVEIIKYIFKSPTFNNLSGSVITIRKGTTDANDKSSTNPQKINNINKQKASFFLFLSNRFQILKIIFKTLY